MNGEIFQICMIVSAARKALKSKKKIVFTEDEFVDSIEFQFLPQKKLFHTNKCTACNIVEWYEICCDRGVSDYQMICPDKVNDRQLLGFANTSRASVLTIYNNQKTTYWTATWDYQRDKNKWKIIYTENRWDQASDGKLEYRNNSYDFKKTLDEIANFADLIGFKNFGDIFRSAFGVMAGDIEIPTTRSNGRTIQLPQIADDKKRIFYAALTADVFGAMGSWNDSPPYYAHEMGLDQRYEELSDELLRQIRLAMLYSINEDNA